jgi:hypothetical protein
MMTVIALMEKLKEMPQHYKITVCGVDNPLEKDFRAIEKRESNDLFRTVFFYRDDL